MTAVYSMNTEETRLRNANCDSAHSGRCVDHSWRKTLRQKLHSMTPITLIGYAAADDGFYEQSE